MGAVACAKVEPVRRRVGAIGVQAPAVPGAVRAPTRTLQ
ncbi:protein of unassigned function [Methylobacterium oryzae CBMB20]|jgi:hypothetical protein|uniref:Protein of unassigned function n=1 Tax=Methylobacterium oryzae CBMB20 TaxID=693986 RepID=A0A089P4J3_9HYPH|nr:protein of unassigned function [Methylobacterium oryzae CBMB20]